MHTAPADPPARPAVASRAGGRFKQRLLRVDAADALPISLKHERIYILPTLRGLAFVAVSLVMILASINYGLNLGYALSFILVGLFASCLLSTYLNLSQLTIDSVNSEDTFAGSPIEYEVTVSESLGRARYSISLQAMGDKSTLDLQAHQQTAAVLRHSQTMRGEHQLGRVTISSDFPLGLWRGWGYIHAPVRSFVYPKPETPVKTFPANKSQTSATKTVTPDEREFDQLKRYQQTDSPSSVAWKTVASGRGWFSKEFTNTESGQQLEFSWSATQELADPEQRLSRLSAWIVQAEATATPYRLSLPGNSTTTSRGPEHRRTCLRSLAGFQSLS